VHRLISLYIPILTLCSAHNVIAALLKRLAHRNPNVQLYTLSLSDSLSKNCGIKVNKEIASRAFTQGLEKLVTDRVCAWLCSQHGY
jgi:hypothetical protein